ncbi:MAG: PD40 domain-containing protein [Anaerolineales bacterium]|nr:PD40 domain-containing protein [Anaerolineales bacterium]
MDRVLFKLSIFIGLTLLLMFTPAPEGAYAQWPPFSFNLTPLHEQGKIIYYIRFSTQVDWPMSNVTFKIPLPEGTRFVEAKAQPTTQVTFDGSEITFFTAFYYQPIRDASFVVEIIDPAKTVFTTHAWISWQGLQPGDYLAKDVSLDITRQTTTWEAPVPSRLRLRAIASVADDIITYRIYPTNLSRLRMWDLKINVPVPEGTTFVSAEAPPPFATNFDGREVSFFTSEIEQQTDIALSFKVSTEKVTTPLVVTHAWATWKNVGRSVGRTIDSQEDNRSGDIVVEPHAVQQVISDRIGDVPFPNYDLTSIALQNDASDLKVTFYTVGKLGAVGEPFHYRLYIDKDCSLDTGSQRGELGRDFQILYRHDDSRASFNVWDSAQKRYVWVQPLKFQVSANDSTIALWIPLSLLENNQHLCWQIEAKYATTAYNPSPSDEITTEAYYDVGATTSISGTQVSTGETPSSIPGEAIDATETSAKNVAAQPAPAITPITGKIAIPLDNGRIHYDVHLYNLPDGRELFVIPNARQPNLRFDGQRILVNREGDGVENIYEYNLTDGAAQQVGDASGDSHPYYDPWGNRVAYGNAELVLGANGRHAPFIFVQCGLMPPHLETEPRCRDIPSLGVLVPAGQMGEIQGTHPVWTSSDMIAYRGCNTWAGARLCGIYSVPSTSTKGLSDGFIPRQLTSDTSDIPSDTKGTFIAFTSQRDGNWEAYIMDLNGGGVKNLSNSPDSNEGLPTISPDGNWVAFVSDRNGLWAVWAVPITGGDAQKLFDLPPAQPWGDGDRSWTNERISWGP